ncbi:MAG TPA: LytTR family DNA-binding domain-containing protein [Thermoanaerobaculia bacterium]|nr:LytTR family DNA-binding domain-containing protein [Thermoanaerobaculia bacterium]
MRTLPRPLVIALSWLAIAVIAAALAATRAAAMNGRVMAAVGYELLILPFWVAATPVIFYAAKRWPIRDARRLAYYALAFLAFFVATNAIIRIPHPFGRNLVAGLATFLVPATLAFAALVAIGHLLAREKESTHLVVADRGSALRVPLDAIDWLQAEDNYVLIHTADRSYTARQKIGDVETQLDAQRFVRVHRSAIVRIGAVRTVKALTHGDYEVVLAKGTVVRGSRSRREALERLRVS